MWRMDPLDYMWSGAESSFSVVCVVNSNRVEKSVRLKRGGPLCPPRFFPGRFPKIWSNEMYTEATFQLCWIRESSSGHLDFDAGTSVPANRQFQAGQCHECCSQKVNCDSCTLDIPVRDCGRNLPTSVVLKKTMNGASNVANVARRTRMSILQSISVRTSLAAAVERNERL